MRTIICFLILCIGYLSLTTCDQVDNYTVTYPLQVKSMAPQKAASIAQQIRSETAVEIVPGLELDLWASDSLITDPIAISVDPQGGIYYNNGTRLEHSEFDIRGHRDWMTTSISWETVEDRRNFLRQTFDPANSEKNKDMLEDLNEDGSHDWHDLTVEKESVWRIEDTDGDGYADRTQMYIEDFHEEISDLANGIEFANGEVYISVGPDLWKTKDQDGDGIADFKKSLAHGFAVHIGFGAHGMSGVKLGPDGRIWWGIGDIGMNLVDQDGKRWKYPNQGVIVRCEPDGSNFEVFAAGLRNTHEFDFDKYGNLISEDNDGDHAGERERLVYLTYGSDSGWRANWQYGKYTDPKNNKYKVWMDERMSVPRWDGQAAYITPPIINYVNGPTGFVYNPGTALSDQWKEFFFVAEFRGTAALSPVHAFKLKPRGATFELDTTIQVVKGLLPTGLDFGPDGALYFADWIDGWGIKEEGRLWKLDVAGKTLSAKRAETKALIQTDFTDLKTPRLRELLDHEDMRIRQKAQFELVNRNKEGIQVFEQVLENEQNQLAKIHALWGLGQLSRKDQALGVKIAAYLDDQDAEIQAQVAKLLGDIRFNQANHLLIQKLKSPIPRVQFFAAEALGRIGANEAIQPLIELIETNNDQDAWLRHAGSYALAQIGDSQALKELNNHPSMAVRTAAVVALRRMQDPGLSSFLNDPEEFIVTEAARAINDDYSVMESLADLANILNSTSFQNEALIRRSINANLRVGGEGQMKNLIQYIQNVSNPAALRAEALATLRTWNEPSVLDRVDGRYRGPITREKEPLVAALDPMINKLLQDEHPEVLIEAMKTIATQELQSHAQDVYVAMQSIDNPEVMTAGLQSLHELQANSLSDAIEFAMDSKYQEVRNEAITILPESQITDSKAVELFNELLNFGTTREKQAALAGLTNIKSDEASKIITYLLQQMTGNQLDPGIQLDVLEAAESRESSEIQELLTQINASQSDDPLAKYLPALEGGNARLGRRVFFEHEAAQCVRCHTVWEWGGTAGPSLQNVADRLSKRTILESLIYPSTRLAPGFGVVTLELKNGESISGFLETETDQALVVKAGNGTITEVLTSDIVKRQDIPSSMPPVGPILNVREIRDLVAFLSSLKAEDS